MTEAIVVFCTMPNDEHAAANLARDLADTRLAACVNLLPSIRSFYRWQGTVHDDSEIQLLIKTRRARFDELRRWLREHHPYEVPEIVALPIAHADSRYLAWIDEQTS